MSNIKAVIFDMDGVLVDAKDWHYDALNRALNLYGYNIGREKHLETYDGLPTKKKLEMLTEKEGLPSEFHKPINKIKQMYTADMARAFCSPTPNHPRAMHLLRQEGYGLAVASNSVKDSVELMMQLSGLTPYLDFMLSNEDVSSAKPAPDIYLKAAERFNLRPEECLVLEDNKNGIAAAQAAGTNLMIIENTIDVTYENITECIGLYNAKSA